jgi:hypothetical protein
LAAATNAKAIPVLPEVGSMMVVPGFKIPQRIEKLPFDSDGRVDVAGHAIQFDEGSASDCVDNIFVERHMV